MEMGPDGKKLYVANGLTNDMTVIDVATLSRKNRCQWAAFLGVSPSNPDRTAKQFGNKMGRRKKIGARVPPRLG
jgi:hypothetical protein